MTTFTLNLAPEELLSCIMPRATSDEVNQRRQKYMLELMQSYFPGNYDTVEKYDPVSDVWKFTIVFRNEEDEIWFRLKYG